MYRGELHDRFWIYWYQLLLAERAVHAALLASLDVDPGFSRLAESILEGYVDRYASYPNVDNVLGPTRLFFSTYLESIWLLQICFATDLLDARSHGLADRVRESIIAPARAIIAEFDEGASNRQVWNDAALLASARMLGDEQAAEHAVFGPSGVVSHIANGLLRDGTWYEGENYHMFAHRGLWYGVTLAEQAGLQIPNELIERFQLGFSTPFMTALPDFTLPSRRDSQYAISLRQWRIAEHCEFGLARTDDPTLIGALQPTVWRRRSANRHLADLFCRRRAQWAAVVTHARRSELACVAVRARDASTARAACTTLGATRRTGDCGFRRNEGERTSRSITDIPVADTDTPIVSTFSLRWRHALARRLRNGIVRRSVASLVSKHARPQRADVDGVSQRKERRSPRLRRTWRRGMDLGGRQDCVRRVGTARDCRHVGVRD